MSSSDFDALNDAVISGSNEIINYLLLKKKSLSKESLMHISLHRRNHSVLELLLQRGADINNKDSNGKTVLELAIEYAFPEFVKTLINHGANLEIQTNLSLDKYNPSSYSLLHKAVHVGNIEIIKLLLKKGLDPNPKTKLGFHPPTCKCAHNCYYYYYHSHYTIQSEDYAFRRTLSVLDVAIICNPKEGSTIIDLLCKNRARVEVESDHYFPLHLAVLEGADTSKIEKLLEYGANVNSLCGDLRYTPLSHAVLKEDATTVSYLLKKGATFYRGSINSVLHQLVVQASPKTEEFLGLLLNCGAEMNSKNGDGRTALHLAISTRLGMKNHLQLLLEYGADINAQDEEGNTPLHSAILSGNDVALRVLIEYDADVSVLNKSEEHPLAIAIERIDLTNLRSRFIAADGKSDYGDKGFSEAEVTLFLIIQAIVVREARGSCVDAELLSFVKMKVFFFYQAFSRELEEAKLKEVKGNLSYFDLLTKRADFVEPLVSERFLESWDSSEIDEQFPFYGEMVKMRISRIRDRLALVKCSGGFFKSVFRLKYAPPKMVSGKICSFLSSFDLINLWRVCRHSGEYLSTLFDRTFV